MTDTHPTSSPAPSASPGPTLEGAQNPTPINRELSWLRFNERVLHMASRPDLPVLDRVRFLAISANNLDEFVMKRIGGLERQIRAAVATASPDGRTPKELLETLREHVGAMQDRQSAVFNEELKPTLRGCGVDVLDHDDLTEEERASLSDWCRARVFPVLTPLAVDPGHPFPFISNLSVSLGVSLSLPDNMEELFARLKIPAVLPQWVNALDPAAPLERAKTVRLVPLEQVIRHNLDDVFPGMIIKDVMPFRVTRSADVERDEEDADDLLASIAQEMKQRRVAEVVRLEVDERPPERLLRFVVEEIDLDARSVVSLDGPLDMASLFELADLDRPDLKTPPFAPVVPSRLRDQDASIFSVIRQGDILVHHPYDSFSASVERFVRDAARDPRVLVIKQTIYRTSQDSPFVEKLIAAAESGKQVACLVELRARFDEISNIAFAQRLERAGVHVTHGVLSLKTHAKIALVVRKEDDAPNGLRAYAHIGTGNYHPRTAQVYTDVGLLTCDPDITEDVIELFNYLTGRSRKRAYKRLLVAPASMRDRFIEFIDREIDIAGNGGRGRIVAKMNQLEDDAIIAKLYEASRAGVSVDLIVRGFCCLRPGVKGASENIRVTSVVGRFLAHSRIFHFGAGKADPVDGDWFIGSADWMHRNLDARVEAITPVLDRAARERLHQDTQAMLAEHTGAWALGGDGAYTPKSPPRDAPEESPEHLGAFEWIIRKAQRDAAEQ